MRLMLLGASYGQLSLIKKMKALGHYIIAVDYATEPVGKQLVDEHIRLSTFDVGGVVKASKKMALDGVLTGGTDQPVYTATAVQQVCGLPQSLTVTTAKRVTNKKIMKNCLMEAGIPVVDYCFYQPRWGNEQVAKLTFPVVSKPIDSQGQRGIYRLETLGEVQRIYPQVIEHSRCRTILIESHYPNEEVTLSGWVTDGQLTVLSLTDRQVLAPIIAGDSLGICRAHTYPSKFWLSDGRRLTEMSQKICEVVGIRQGPVYFQFLIGRQGIRVNEIACRLGGAFEGVFIPEITGFSIVEAIIKQALGQSVQPPNCALFADKKVSVQFFFGRPGVIATMTPTIDLASIEGVEEVAYYLKEGQVVGPIENATARLGYAVVITDTEEQLKRSIELFYRRLKVTDTEGREMVIKD